MLDRSLDRFMRDKMGITYRIQASSEGPSLTDLSGTWWLILDPASYNKTLLEKNLQRADNADSDYYKKAISQALHIESQLEGFELYRGELTLGFGSICDDKPCNLAVLTKQGEPNMYLLISKN